MGFHKKSDWNQTSLNPALSAELQRMDDGIQENSDRTSIPSADKVANALTIKLNSGAEENSTKFTFDGSAGKTIDLTPANLECITDGPVSWVYENQSGSTRYVKIADRLCESTYDKVNQTLLISQNAQAIILTVTLSSLKSTQYSECRLAYAPLTSGYSTLVDNLCGGLVTVSDTSNRFELWYKQSNHGSSLTITLLGRNFEKKSRSALTFYTLASTTATEVADAPAFSTAVSLTNEAADHTHLYASSSTAGGSANSAVKLATARKINGVAFDGSANISITADPTANQLTSEDLDTIKTPGFYFAGGANTCTNKPDSIDSFGLAVYKTAGGYIQQELTGGNTSYTKSKKFFRQYNNSTWSTWSYYFSSLYPQTSLSGYSAATATNTSNGLAVARRGTWTPTSTVLTFVNATGGYIRLGSYVHCWFDIELDPDQVVTMSGSTPAAIQFYGLPFPISYDSMCATWESSSYNQESLKLGSGSGLGTESAFNIYGGSSTSICLKLLSASEASDGTIYVHDSFITDYSYNSMTDGWGQIRGNFSYLC